jgi:hypothetical protein
MPFDAFWWITQKKNTSIGLRICKLNCAFFSWST